MPLNLLLHATVHPACVQDRDVGILVMAILFGMFPFVKKLFQILRNEGRLGTAAEISKSDYENNDKQFDLWPRLTDRRLRLCPPETNFHDRTVPVGGAIAVNALKTLAVRDIHGNKDTMRIGQPETDDPDFGLFDDSVIGSCSAHHYASGRANPEGKCEVKRCV